MGEAVVAHGDAAEVLEASEHALDRVAIPVEAGREAVLPTSIGLRRDVGRGTFALDLAAYGVRVVALGSEVGLLGVALSALR
jgi:hypothetical protein